MPGRVKIPLVVLGPDGRPLPGATGAVRRRVDGTPVPVYAAETGGTTLSPSQIVTDDLGRMAGWTDRGALEAVVSPPVGVTLDPYIASWEALPGADESSEAGWHADQSVPGRALTNASVELDDLAASALGLIFAIGDMWPTCNPGDRAGGRILSADGRLLSSASYPELDALIGNAAPAATRHAYNDGVDPGGGQFRIPDKRGRSSRGADDFGTARGAAGRLNSLAAGDRVLGQAVGVDSVTLLAAQSGMPAHAHGHTISVGISSNNIGQPAGWNLPITDSSVDLYLTSPGGAQKTPRTQGSAWSWTSGVHAHSASVGGGISNAAALNATQAHTNLDPSELDHWLIRVL